jgi:hypothetical protein
MHAPNHLFQEGSPIQCPKYECNASTGLHTYSQCLSDPTTCAGFCCFQMQELSSESALRAAYDAGAGRLNHLTSLLTSPPPALSNGAVGLSLSQRPASPGQSNMTKVCVMWMDKA